MLLIGGARTDLGWIDHKYALLFWRTIRGNTKFKKTTKSADISSASFVGR